MRDGGVMRGRPVLYIRRLWGGGYSIYGGSCVWGGVFYVRRVLGEV